jgi:glutamate synthase (NADH) large subunit (EC 1.4.1.14)
MLLIDLVEGRIISDDEIKKTISTAQPYAQWIDDTQLVLEDLPAVRARAPKTARTSSTCSRPSATARKTSRC